MACKALGNLPRYLFSPHPAVPHCFSHTPDVGTLPPRGLARCSLYPEPWIFFVLLTCVPQCLAHSRSSED